MGMYQKPSELNATPITAIKNAFKHCWVYTGRSSRSEYWWFLLLQLIIIGGLFGLGVTLVEMGDYWTYPYCDEAIHHRNWLMLIFGWMFIIISCAGALACLFPSISVMIRRLHDSGRSAWNLFWMLLPAFGWIALLIMTMLESEHYTNEYGGVMGQNYPPKPVPGTFRQPVYTQPPVFTPKPIDITAELQKLATLLQQGAITKEEFETLKAKIINGK